MATARYDDSPQRLDDYVTLEEVADLLADGGRHLAKDHRRTAHFLERVKLTIQAFRSQVQGLHRDVQSMQIRSTSVGAPTTLDPRSAAKFLPPEELATLADELIAQKFAALADADRENKATRSDLVRKVNALKFAVSTITEDFSIPDEIRTKIANAFSGALDVELPEETTVGTLQGAAPPPSPEPSNDSLDDLFS